MGKIALTLASALLVAPLCALAESMVSDAPENAEAYFIQPMDGATVDGTFKVVFGLRNIGVAPAGVEKENTGHHHLLIDSDMPSDLTQPLPASDQVKHFGGGQTEAEITLPPGEHTLQLLLGNHLHVPHNPPVASEQISITVE
ncbi:DUF4399 domain-containing protein [Marinobacter sp. chi1]|uniref:DUF4399 domain-containing protein n=1 Tax=Marinobacter suaedae TaxID=3057675 RepID=A0ABT8W019_9GAMM|nr:DUF4399 domain-containing protein [Marinobacter sp. chi1]MDO3721574.1 DUF4399 domain-containing protein [Marinobacter sp. chi1]